MYFEQKLNNFLLSYTQVKLTCFSLLFIFIFGCPDFSGILNLTSPINYSAYKTTQKQIDQPLSKEVFKKFSPHSHEAKQAFRPFPVLMAKVFNVNSKKMFLIQYLFGILMIALSVKWLMNTTNNALVSFYLIISISAIYAGKIAFINTGAGVYDGIAICIALIVFIFKSRLINILGFICAGLTDERAFFACFSIAIYYVYEYNTHKKFKPLALNLLSILIGSLIYLFIRLMIQKIVAPPSLSINDSFAVYSWYFVNHISTEWQKAIQALEGLWLIIFVSILKLNNYLIKSMYIILIAIITTVAFAVIDIDRSLAYLLPLVYFSIEILKKTNSLNKRNCFYLMIICLIIPSDSFWKTDFVYGHSQFFLFELIEIINNI